MMMFTAGLALFFGLHLYSAFRSRTPDQDRRVLMGDKKFMGLYSIAALAGFVLIVMGYGATRPSPDLYMPPSWGIHVNMLLTLIAFIAFTASQIPAGHIKKRLKHPMLIAVKLWAAGHLLSNGELNSVILFTAFLAFAVIDRIRVKRRGDTGAAKAQANPIWDFAAIIMGLGLYALFLSILHPILIGVPILP